MQTKLIDSFEKARSFFPHTKDVVYFNSASYGPFSTLVADAVNENINIRMRADYDDSHDAFSVRTASDSKCTI